MSWRAIFTVYRKELRDMLRDRRAMISMIVIPLFVMPGMTLGLGTIGAKADSAAKSEVHTVMVVGGADSPKIVADLQAAKSLRFVPPTDDWRQKITDKAVRAVVQIPAGFEVGLKVGAASPVTVYSFKGEPRSGYAANQLREFFEQLRQRTIAEQLTARNQPASLLKPFELTTENVAPPEKVGGALFGGFVPYIIILLCFTGAMYPALDLTAGEKERGTMETLLCSPASRTSLVLGKFLMVLTGSLSAMCLSLLSMTVSAVAGGMAFNSAKGAMAAQAAAKGGLGFSIDPVGVLGVMAMVLPVTVLFSAIIFTVALFAKSYKEAQTYVAPMIFIVIVPAVAGIFPGVDLNAKLALVPILNVSLACKEMLSGVWHWPQLALIFASTAAYAGIALSVAVAMFKRESVMFRS